MLNVISRVCQHPMAYSGICRTVDLQLKSRIQESDNIYSFIFTTDQLPSWKAGQHSIFTLPEHNVTGKSYRPFSVASAPHEGVIRIGTIISDEPSSFKQNLLSLQEGQMVRMHGPYGEFYIRSKMKQIIGIAGGIGITPFRSIVADLSQHKSETPLTLIYSAQPGLHTYKDELDEWTKDRPNLNIIYTNTSDEVNAELDKLVTEHKNNAHYFISGSPGMITAIKKNLSSKGVKNIVNDPFKGY